MQSQETLPSAASSPATSPRLTTRVQPVNPMPTVSKATVTRRVVPSRQETCQAPLAPQSNRAGTVFESSATLVRSGKVSVSGAMGVQVVVPRVEGSTSVPESRK